jgi:uncharacterized membrane protein YccC
MTKRLLNTIKDTDPGLLAARRSLKTFIAIALSLAIYHQQPKMALFAVITALLFSRSQAGATIEERKFTMLTTGLIMMLLSVPVSLIAAYSQLSVIFITLFAFIIFFLIGAKKVPDFPAVVVLSVTVVQMAFSRTAESGLRYAGLFAVVTALVYFLHFVILPTRPRRRLQLQAGIIADNLYGYYRQVTGSHPTLDRGIGTTQDSNAAVLKSLNDFRRLWQLFRVNVTGDATPEGKLMQLTEGLRKVHEYLVMVWQFRAQVWRSALYQELITGQPLIHEVIKTALTYLNPATKILGVYRLKSLGKKLDTLKQSYFNDYNTGAVKADREEWVAIFNTLNTLEQMLDDIVVLEISEQFDTPAFSISNKTGSIVREMKSLAGSIRQYGAALRFGIRSAIIIGGSQLIYRFFEPEYGYWLVLFAVLLIRPNLGISIKTGRDRLLGTIAGSGTAVVFLLVAAPGSILFYSGMAIAIFAMIWFTNLEKQMSMIIALTLVILATFSMIYSWEEKMALLRIGYTAVIVLAVIVISFLLWPEKARKQLAGSMAHALDCQRQYFNAIIQKATASAEQPSTGMFKPKLGSLIENLDQLMNAAKNEVINPQAITHGLKIRIYIKRLRNTLSAMDMNIKHPGCTFSGFDNEIKAFATAVDSAFESLVHALQKLNTPAGYPPLDKELDRLIEQFIAYRKQQKQNEEIMELWMISNFVWNLKPLVSELKGIKQEIEMKMRGV